MTISTVLIVKNAEKTIAHTLSALSWCEEVVCYDTGSTDKSIDIATSFDNVRVIHGYFDGFGCSKNRAITHAKYDWILSLDADEVPDDDLIQSIQQFPYNDPHHIGMITRKNRLCGEVVCVGGLGHDNLIRLFNRTVYQFDNRPVHEAIAIDTAAKTIAMPGILMHDTVTDIGQFLQKIDYYTMLSAAQLPRYPFWLIVAKSIFAFLRSYFLQYGFIAGWRGFTIAYCDAIGVYFKYLRAYIHHECK